jgi:thiamine pyrophosphate-dependent acetolactate synthase large subunit-like protein
MSMDLERAERYPLRRREVVARLLAERGDLLVVAGLGAPNWDCTAAGDHPLTFPLWGAMGGALPMGLGLALAQPRRRVLVVTGDGELLMGLTALATVGVKQPKNLAVAVLDNERYGETGAQPTATAARVDLAAMALAAGWREASKVADEAALARALPRLRSADGPLLANIKVRAENLPFVMPPKDGAHLKHRFRLALLGDRAVAA